MSVARVLVVSFVVAGLFGAVPSASADKILFKRLSRATGEQAWVMRSDGSGAHRVLDGSLARRIPNIETAPIDLSLDGRRLAWTDNNGSLWTETFTRRNMRLVSRNGLASPRWSPSAKQIAGTHGVKPPASWQGDESGGGFAQIFVLRADGSRRRRLSTPANMFFPDWSPDGRRIVAVGVGPQLPEICTGTPPAYVDAVCTFPPPPHIGLWVVEVASGAAREIVGFDDGSSVGRPVWSPAGQTIAFDRYLRTDTEEKGQLWTINPDGGGLRQLTQLTGGATAPSWSPSGRRIAISTRMPQQLANIATIRADGSGLRILTHSRLNLKPDWSR
jgi:dipeptidyl aminopeptidase/acylaminoacyl peptidase